MASVRAPYVPYVASAEVGVCSLLEHCADETRILELYRQREDRQASVRIRCGRVHPVRFEQQFGDSHVPFKSVLLFENAPILRVVAVVVQSHGRGVVVPPMR